MSDWLSSETASNTAAISSASGGSGMYSLAPALIARTAISGLTPMPQATTGMTIRSSPRLRIKSGMLSPASIMIRSAPRPARRVSSARAISPACITLAPRAMAIWLAAPIWPFNEPMMSSLMVNP
jgi:hypothetical protein